MSNNTFYSIYRTNKLNYIDLLHNMNKQSNRQYGGSANKCIHFMQMNKSPFTDFLSSNSSGLIVINIDSQNISKLFSHYGIMQEIITDNDQYTEPNYTNNVFGFWYPSKNAPVDDKYKVPEFGNFYHTKISIKIFGTLFTFTNVEAAFHAFKLLHIDVMNGNNTLFKNIHAFQNMSGEQSYQESKKYTSQLHASWHKCKYCVMYLLLSAKFGYCDPTHQGSNGNGLTAFITNFGHFLLKTNDAYLGEYTPNNDEWGFDYNKNKGNNWLGRLLMVKRKELGGLGKPTVPNSSNLTPEMYYFQMIKNEMNGNSTSHNQTDSFPNNEIKRRFESVQNKLEFQNTQFNKGYVIIEKYVPHDTSKHVYAIKLNKDITDQRFINHLMSNVRDVEIFSTKPNIIYIRNTPDMNSGTPHMQNNSISRSNNQNNQNNQSSQQLNIPLSASNSIASIQAMLDFQNRHGKNYAIQNISQASGKHSFAITLNNDITPGFAGYLRSQGFDVYLQSFISHKNRIIYF